MTEAAKLKMKTWKSFTINPEVFNPCTLLYLWCKMRMKAIENVMNYTMYNCIHVCAVSNEDV